MDVASHSWPVRSSRLDCARLLVCSWCTVFFRVPPLVGVAQHRMNLLVATYFASCSVAALAADFLQWVFKWCQPFLRCWWWGWWGWLPIPPIVFRRRYEVIKIAVKGLHTHWYVSLRVTSRGYWYRKWCRAMRSPKLSFSSGGFIFYHKIFCCRTIGGFPPWPRALGNIEFFLILVGAGELICDEHGFCWDDDKHRIGDGAVCLFGLGLGVFDVLDVFWDALSIKTVSLHLVLWCKDIKGMELPTHCLEMGERLPCVDKDIVSLVPLEFAGPRVFDHTND